MNNDDYFSIMATFSLILIVFICCLLRFGTSDHRITEGKVFKLQDATYQCKQVQKLEYVE